MRLMVGGAGERGDGQRAVGPGDAGDVVAYLDIRRVGLQERARDGGQLGPQSAAGQRQGAAGKHERAAGERAEAVGGAVGVAVDDAHAVGRDAERVRDDLREGGGEALAVG